MNLLAVWAGWPFTANYQTANSQTSTGSDTSEREGAPTPYGKPTKPQWCPHSIAHVAFMPKVSAPTCKQKLVRLVSTTQDPAHNKIIKHTHSVFQRTRRGPPCQSIASAARGRPVTDTSALRSLAEGDLFS